MKRSYDVYFGPRISDGFGFLAVVVPILAVVFANVIADACFGREYSDTHTWQRGVALIVAGAFCWRLGVYLNGLPRDDEANRSVVKQTFLRRKHALLYVPLQWWGPVIAVAGALYGILSK